MIESVKGILAGAGLMKDHVHEEKYFTTSGDAEPVAAPAVAAPRPAPAAPGGIVLKSVKPPGAIVLKSVPIPPG
jgi:hypothetical protein